MSIRSLRSIITHNLVNIPGWRTDRKIVVIESDDWGSVRMASQKVYQTFLKKGFPVGQNPYNKYDALECNEDLERLYDVLSSIEDANGNPAVITANCVVANPDFKKIKSHGYQKYFYEPFTETLKQYPAHSRVFDLYKEGIHKRLIWPQYHGREHLNVTSWMKALQNGDEIAHEAFNNQMFTVHSNLYQRKNKLGYIDALNFNMPSEIKELKSIVSEGMSLFKDIWGFTSSSFIAPSYIWNRDIEFKLHQHGVKYIQGVAVQKEPREGERCAFRLKLHYNGQKNSFGQVYLVRNSFFEPSQRQNVDWISDCLNRINVAFRWKKPAIISSHRLNYIGFIDPKNRARNLSVLKKLLFEIVKQWPNVEFMNSSQLGDLMKNNNCV